MQMTWPGSSASSTIVKAQFLSNIINKVIREIGANASGKYRCDIALIGYEGNQGAFSLWKGGIQGKEAVSIVDVVNNPAGTATQKEQKSDPIEGVIEVERKYDYWMEPTIGGSTPMGRGLGKARQIIEQWLTDEKHQDSFPPVVLHVTDGEPDSNERNTALREAEQIKNLSTSDGNVMLFTVHIPSENGATVLFPVSEADLPAGDESGKLLFQMSSILPQEMVASALEAGLEVQSGCRLMVRNADAMAAAKLITWGSSSGGARTTA
jgi:hypothetical protein